MFLALCGRVLEFKIVVGATTAQALDLKDVDATAGKI